MPSSYIYYKIESISLTRFFYVDCLSGGTYVDVLSSEGPTYVCSLSFPEYESGSRDYVITNEGDCNCLTPTPTITPTLTPTPTQTPTQTHTPTHTPTSTNTIYTHSCLYYEIINYNTVQQGFYSWTGCTGIISITPINPLESHQVCCLETPMVEQYGAPLTIALIGLCPSITPTPSVTPTNTITPSKTPTQTPTPSITQTFIPVYNLWSGGYFEDACSAAGYGPADVAIYSVIPFEALQIGDYVYGNAACTIPPILTVNIVSDGARWIQLEISDGLVLDVGICF